MIGSVCENAVERCMKRADLRAPFPYFGGKRHVAHLVWAALGDVDHYIEPFFGSGAVLLARPNYDPSRHVETVVDKDAHLANVWRALQAAPDEVARYCDWPVNHADLIARRRALIAAGEQLAAKIMNDDTYYDAKLAGYWIWVASCAIRPPLHDEGRPRVTNAGMGINALGQRPHITNAGMGIHALRRQPAGPDLEAPVTSPYNENIYRWFRALSERLRYVRVVCGDWTRVCGGNWQDDLGTVGIFFDPPYAVNDRDHAIYRVDDPSVAHAVRQWALERGSRRTYRIVIAGYEEHEELLNHGWTRIRWKGHGGLGRQSTKRENKNRFRETLYLSPHCLVHQLELFL